MRSNLGHPITDAVERGPEGLLFIQGNDQKAFAGTLAESSCLGILGDHFRDLRRGALDQKGGPFADAGGPTLLHGRKKAFNGLRQRLGIAGGQEGAELRDASAFLHGLDGPSLMEQP